MGLHRNWSLKRLKSPPLHHCRAGEFNSTGQASVSRTTRRFIPNVPHPETTGCPRNRPWACVCCVCGVSCERCSVWVRGKVFVSPSPGPSVCCVSVECAWCCGSSTERRPDPGPERRGPHLETQDGGGDMDHTSDDRTNTSTDFNLVWCRRLYMLLDIMICPTCCSLTNSGVIFWT